jgi:hypothetical protein
MTSREELHRTIDDLDEEQLRQVKGAVEGILGDDLRRHLSRIPGVQVPANWPPRFDLVERLRVEGEPMSEHLMRERR